mmetsp:Transcript_26616/g.58452  ORF Transcript_26616/g.58452 Transcript_26616/m.58452 type:complete len:408 (+) Transcript_26616:57-1280(+)|eukprot:CAMPEP_0170609958 /NCGR_PEP_ID=MMETSP0224-20130122/22397_1 /TAXON_ID=285029 /ORGANISM="Togula jolla, Strain CCCM 725" /LENGTH=407 /DNA_ID=CAMNT_0010935289 /DNA_START=44 /DNA_END=1267 /DNA_ORIENTATION=+
MVVLPVQGESLRLSRPAYPAAKRGSDSQRWRGQSWAGLTTSTLSRRQRNFAVPGACSVACGVVVGAVAARSSRKGRRAWLPSLREASARTALRAELAGIQEGRKLELFSPAKINLFLRIVRRRPDGYHDLASLFQAVAFGDTLELELLPESAESDLLECNLPGVPVDESNLVIRAFNLFRKMSGVQRFFRAQLRKRIPAQAGMGGGSSNAAAAFFGANELCGRPGSPEDLIRWTEDPVIGSDATFFLSEGTAYCTGRGEIITPVAPLPVPKDLAVVLVKPRTGLSTPKVFKALDISAVSPLDPEDLLQKFQTEGVAHKDFVNDLEPPAFEVCPELGELKDFLSDPKWGFQAVMMSGSGTTIFGIGAPTGGLTGLEAAVRESFDIEGVWQTTLMRRPSPQEWYTAPEV